MGEFLQVSSQDIAVEKEEAEQALAAAIPVLEEAAAALQDLKKDDITEIRSFAKPHILVQKVSQSKLRCCVTRFCCLRDLQVDPELTCSTICAGL